MLTCSTKQILDILGQEELQERSSFCSNSRMLYQGDTLSNVQHQERVIVTADLIIYQCRAKVPGGAQPR